MTGDNDTITLADAAKHFGFGVATLRAEADRGHLTIYKIGRAYYTTPADIREMVDKCRVEARGQDFTAIKRADSGSSEMAAASLDAAREATLKLRNSSRGTSLPNTSPRRLVRR